MTDTVISDGFAAPHDEGLPNISDGNEDWGSAGLMMMLSQAVNSGSYVRSDSELTFTSHDGSNDQVGVTGGVAYLDLTGETVEYQSSYGGSSPPSYDTELPTLPAIMVVVPETVDDLDVADDTDNDVWLAYATDDSVTDVSAGDVWLRHGDDLSEPPHPNVKLGTVNPDDDSADDLQNRFGSPTFNEGTFTSLSTDEIFSTPQGALLTKSSEQTLTDGSNEILTWDSSDEYNSAAPSFGDPDNDGFTVPNDDYDRARFTLNFSMDNDVNLDFLRLLVNGSEVDGGIREDNLDASSLPLTSSWISVSSGDTITIETNQSSGSDEDMSSNTTRTWFEGIFR